MRYLSGWILICGLCLTACTTTNYQNVPAEKVAQGVTVRDSEYDKVRTYTGPILHKDTRRGIFQDNIVYSLGANKDKSSGKIQYVVAVQILYIGEWRFYDSISLKGGTRIPVKTLSRKVNFCDIGCSYTETFVAEVDSLTMAVWAEAGLTIRINSQVGADDELSFSSSYVTGFLAGLSHR